MTYKGHIENGAVVLDEPVQLPEGSRVIIQSAEATASLRELLGDVAGRGKDLPDDGSVQHDHYIYGSPKR
jgi:hypothetical protein